MYNPAISPLSRVRSSSRISGGGGVVLHATDQVLQAVAAVAARRAHGLDYKAHRILTAVALQDSLEHEVHALTPNEPAHEQQRHTTGLEVQHRLQGRRVFGEHLAIHAVGGSAPPGPGHIPPR